MKNGLKVSVFEQNPKQNVRLYGKERLLCRRLWWHRSGDLQSSDDQEYSSEYHKNIVRNKREHD